MRKQRLRRDSGSDDSITWSSTKISLQTPDGLGANYSLAPSANAGTHETPVILQQHFAAGEKIGHGCDRFFLVPGAGTYCQDQIPE
jgi:hypothetical protein